MPPKPKLNSKMTTTTMTVPQWAPRKTPPKRKEIPISTDKPLDKPSTSESIDSNKHAKTSGHSKCLRSKVLKPMTEITVTSHSHLQR